MFFPCTKKRKGVAERRVRYVLFVFKKGFICRQGKKKGGLRKKSEKEGMYDSILLISCKDPFLSFLLWEKKKRGGYGGKRKREKNKEVYEL